MSDTLIPPVDMESLLRPISTEAPCGEYLRYEGTYDKIQEARREDDPNLPQGVWKTSLKKANWAQVQRLCRDALAHQTKDLQIGAWLLEAWVVQQGFRGAAQGFKLLAKLVETFWEHLYPAMDDGDVSFRLGPIDWLEQRLGVRLKAVILAKPQRDGQSYSYADLEFAIHREKENRKPADDPDSPEAQAEAQLPTQERFQVSMSMTPPAYLQGTLRDIDDTLAAITELEGAVLAHAGEGHVSLRGLQQLLAEIRGVVQQAAGGGAAEDDEHEGHGGSSGQEEGGEEAGHAPAGGGRSGPIKSRADAYRRLIEAADFLMRTEPHSPTPYLVKRAVSWGNMSLTELLAELVQSPDSLHTIYALLGIRRAE